MRSAEDEPTLQSRVERAGAGRGPAGGPAGQPTVADPVMLLRHLQTSGRFHRDGPIGRLFHRGMLSLREHEPTDCLHVVVERDRIAAHVDRVSPLASPTGGRSRYSLRRAVAHNLAGMGQDLAWLVRGRQGDHRSELSCEWVPGGPGELALLDPRASSWSVQLDARVAGSLDEARLRAALDAVLGLRGAGPDLLAVVDCDDDGALAAARSRLEATVVGADQHPPLRACLAHHDAGDVLMLNVNHAAADGFGALDVLRRIARAYAGEPDPGPPLEFLSVSDLPVRPAPPPTSAWSSRRTRLVERVRDALTRPARLAADGPGDEPGYGFHLVELSAGATRELGDGPRPGPSRNVLLAALHLAIGDWNLRHGTPGRRVGVLIPANLRPPGWPEDRIGNFSVTARVSTSRRERAGAVAALAAVTAQTARNKRTRTGTALLAGLERAGLLELWAKQSIVVLQPLTANQLVDAALLCNLGRQADVPSFGPDAGDAVKLWFSAPARSPRSLCIGAVTMGGRLHLAFRYPHRLFGADAARRFADCYLEHLRAVANVTPWSP